MMRVAFVQDRFKIGSWCCVAVDGMYPARLLELCDVADRIGSGAYGTIRQARSCSSASTRGYKSLAVKLLKDPEHFEVEAAFSFKHAHVIDLIEAVKGETEKHASALVFPRFDCSLRDFLQNRDEPPTMPISRTIARQMASGLAHVHAANVIHRDLKPANVLVKFVCADATKAFMEVLVVIADFGMARRLQAEKVQHRLVGKKPSVYAEMTARVMTSWYRAPELLYLGVDDHGDNDKGRASYGKPVDVWSFGCVLWEVFMLKPLARSNSLPELVGCLVRLLFGVERRGGLSGARVGTPRRAGTSDMYTYWVHC